MAHSPQFQSNPNVIYLGCTARYTGYDLSGQAILPVTPELAAEAGYTLRCEQCGRIAGDQCGVCGKPCNRDIDGFSICCGCGY